MLLQFQPWPFQVLHEHAPPWIHRGACRLEPKYQEKHLFKNFNQFQIPPSLCDQENTAGLSREICPFPALSEYPSGGQKPRVCPVIKINTNKTFVFIYLTWKLYTEERLFRLGTPVKVQFQIDQMVLMKALPPNWKPSSKFLWFSVAFRKFCWMNTKSGLKLLKSFNLKYEFIVEIYTAH